MICTTSLIMEHKDIGAVFLLINQPMLLTLILIKFFIILNRLQWFKIYLIGSWLIMTHFMISRNFWRMWVISSSHISISTRIRRLLSIRLLFRLFINYFFFSRARWLLFVCISMLIFFILLGLMTMTALIILLKGLKVGISWNIIFIAFILIAISSCSRTDCTFWVRSGIIKWGNISRRVHFSFRSLISLDSSLFTGLSSCFNFVFKC